MKKKKVIQNLCLYIPLFILIAISLIDMKSLSKLMDAYQNYFWKQALWFFIGFLLLFIIKLLNPKRLFSYSKYLYFLNVLLLILVLFFGKTINGSRAWFSFGFFSFQPSELMKFTLSLYLANILSKLPKNNWKQELHSILKALFITIIPSLFVFLEPDTGAIIIYFFILFGALLIYKINFKWYLLFLFLLCILLGSFFYLYYFNKDLLIHLIGTSFFYRVDRILTFVNNDSFQLDRALIAIGTSSFFGSSNYIYVPEYPTDFIVAFTIYNLGLFGFIILLICFLVLDIYFLILLFKTKNKMHKIFISSFLLMFLFAQIENIGMNLGLLPIIGLPLPFVSYGGTNILVYFMFLSILIFIKNEN